VDRGAAGPTAEGTGCDAAAQDGADQRASLPILGLPSALAWPMWRWRGAHRVHSCQEGKGYTSGGFAWCRGLGLAVLERWHHGEWDACGDGGEWRTRMHPRVSRYHQLARPTRFRGAKRRKKGQAGSHVADASVRRRGHGGDAICFAADKNRYIGAVSVGFSSDGKRLRRKSPVRPSRRSRTSSECCKGAQRRAPVFGGIHGPSGGGGLARAWVVGPVGADDPVVPGRRRLCRPSRPRS